MCQQSEKQTTKKIKITSLPKPGLDFKTWREADVKRWWELVRGVDHSAKDISDLERIRKTYRLDRFYSFSN